MDNKKCYILVQKELMNTGVIGVFSDRNVPEQIIKRTEEIIKKNFVITIMKFEILEAPFDSLEFIEKASEFIKNEFKDLMKEET